MDIVKLFESFDDEFLNFDLIEHKLSTRPDMHAFMLLDKMFPGDTDMISAAEHDEIYLSIDPERLVREASVDQIKELIRCGVRYQDEGLCMFV